MPFRLFAFFAFVVLLALFLGFNLDNRCDVSVVFRTFRDVPVVISLLFAYAIGVVSVVPVLLGARRRKNRQDAARNLRTKEKSASPRKGKSSAGDKNGAGFRTGANDRHGSGSRDYGID